LSKVPPVIKILIAIYTFPAGKLGILCENDLDMEAVKKLVNFSAIKLHTVKQLFILFLFAPSMLFAQQSPDLIITNGRIVDGTGNSWFRADIAVKGDRIVAVKKGLLALFPGTKVIDAKNMIVSPGFIDVHAHIEGGVFEKPTADNYIYDGVTSVVTGNCGGAADDIAVFFEKD